ncbi:MAG TPA: PAS domain-containing protein [Burkholderiaceae bacterium]|nr:PAS domain-containing protein [Burkholderiaceae bacterium]
MAERPGMAGFFPTGPTDGEARAADRGASAAPVPAAAGSSAVELALAELEALYAGAPVGIALIDAGMRFVRVNARLAEVHGAPVEAHPGRTVREMLPGPHAQVEAAIRRVLETGEPLRDVEVVGRSPARPDEVRTWVEHFHPLRVGGATVGVTVLATDVTERRRIERALRDSEAHHRAIVEQGPLIPWTCDAEGRLTQLDERWTRMTGEPLERSLGGGWLRSVHPDDLPAVRDAWRRTQERGEPYDVEHRIRGADGGWRWMRSRATPRRDGRDEAVRWYGTSEDVHEGRTARDALREREEFARRLNAVVPCLLYVFDLGERRNVWTNREMAELLGYRPEQFEAIGGRVIDELLHPDDRDRLARHLPRLLALADGESAEFEYRIRAADGDWRWLLSRDMVFRRGPDGRPRQLVGAALDITVRKRVEGSLEATAASLIRERERLAVALRTGRFGVYEWRVGDRGIWWSRETYELFGVDPADFVPTLESFDALVHPEDRAALWAKSDRRLETAEPFVHEYRIVRPDGAVRWIRNQSHAVLDADGRVLRTTGVAADITERREAEAALRDAEERLRLATHAGNIGIWEWDVTSDTVVWSDRTYALHGLAPGEFGGRTADFAALVHPDDREAVAAKLQASLASGVPYAAEFRIVLPDGSDRWISTWAWTHRDRDGRPVRMIGATISIDAYKRVEAALRDGDRRKDEFIAMLSHELRNPLAPLRNALKLVEREALTERGRLALGMGERQVRQLARLVDDLLEVSRITWGKIELHPEPVTLQRVVHEVVDGLAGLLAERGQPLRLELPEAPLVVEADPVRIAQVLENLLSNASKYTDRGGPIVVAVRAEGDDALLEVRDSGIGIAREDLPRLFELFTQIDVSVDRSQGGLGIGLALVRQLVAMHGGRVAAESEGRGRGSTFRVWWPRRASGR